MLTRVTFIVDDKKLGEACRALTGLAAEAPTIQPMANAMVTKAAPRVQPQRNGQTLPDMIMNQIKEEGLERLSASTMKVMVTNLGYAPLSSAKMIQELMHKYKFLRRTGRGQYEVRH